VFAKLKLASTEEALFHAPEGRHIRSSPFAAKMVFLEQECRLAAYSSNLAPRLIHGKLYVPFVFCCKIPSESHGRRGEMEHQIRPQTAVRHRLGGDVGRVMVVDGDRVGVVFSGGKYKHFDASDLVEVKPPRRRAIAVRF
jgi:hypothetical protein